MKIFLKSLLVSLIVFSICIIVEGINTFSMVFSFNFFILYYLLTFFYEKYKVKIEKKIMGK